MSSFAQARKQRLSQVKNKSIAGTSVVSRICNCFGLPANVSPKKPLAQLLGGNLVVWDLGLDLMKYPLFRDDGLNLQKADVLRAKTLGNLGDLVFQWYIADGWSIT